MKIFKYTQLDDGTYSVKIYGRHGTVSSAVSVPESYRGAPVTEVTFGSTLDANFQSLHIPAQVKHIELVLIDRNAWIAKQIFSRTRKSDADVLYVRQGALTRYSEKFAARRALSGYENKFIVFDNTVNELKLFAGEITVDENNKKYRSDGKALYSKDGKTLYRLFLRYIEEYSVMPGT